MPRSHEDLTRFSSRFPESHLGFANGSAICSGFGRQVCPLMVEAGFDAE
jgi:hypothetical protein